jgi:hypothetical protein
MQDPTWKIAKESKKRAEGMAQVVEYLPSKQQALSLKPYTAKNNNSKNFWVRQGGTCL